MKELKKKIKHGLVDADKVGIYPPLPLLGLYHRRHQSAGMRVAAGLSSVCVCRYATAAVLCSTTPHS